MPPLMLYKVTDAREQRPASRPTPQRTGTRLISVDNVLQYASEIPSGQRRAPPGYRPQMHTRTPSGRHPLDPKLSGRGVQLTAGHIPTRSSKVSEKLVLLPETTEEDAEEKGDFEEEDDAAPPKDEELRRRRQPGLGDKSYAERLPKARRTGEAHLARVTAYCTAQSTKLRATAAFVRDQHSAKTKLYDDCLYCVYQLPLLGGSDGYRVRSSPVVKNPGGRSVLDEQIEANERREYREGWHEESDEWTVMGNEMDNPGTEPRRDSRQRDHEDRDLDRRNTNEMSEDTGGMHDRDRRESNQSNESALSFPSPQAAIAPDAMTTAELYIFSYGVAVLWNFTPNQEKDLLADLTFSSSSSLPHLSKSHGFSQKPSVPSPSALPLLTKVLDESDFETEEFHFQYDDRIEKPRIFNDMITLRTSDHMIKLAMSHAIAQSTKLSFFEERMQRTMAEAQYVPRRLALEGRLGMGRAEVVGLVGRLFEGRVDVNLCKSSTLSSQWIECRTDSLPQQATCSTHPTSSGTPNPRCTPCTQPCANTSRSSRGFRC